MDVEHAAMPWTAVEQDDGGWKIEDCDEGYITLVPASRFVDERPDPAQVLHVRMMSAAPEMLAALRAIMEAIENRDEGEAYQIARTATARATGERL